MSSENHKLSAKDFSQAQLRALHWLSRPRPGSVGVDGAFRTHTSEVDPRTLRKLASLGHIVPHSVPTFYRLSDEATELGLKLKWSRDKKKYREVPA